MKRKRVILIAVAVLAAGILVLYYHFREPRYQGRALGDWIEDAAKAMSSPTEYRTADAKWLMASNALQSAGDDAVPLLLKWGSTRETKTRLTIIRWFNKWPALRFHMWSASQRKTMTAVAFQKLGKKSKSAWPILAEWTREKDPNRRETGLIYLSACQADKETLTPVLQRLLNDPEPSVRTQANAIMKWYYPDADERAVLFPSQAATNRPAIK